MKSFLTACGLADLLQLVVESQSAAEGELRLLHQPFALIGRDLRADVVLDHPQVSRRHVYLQVVDGQAFWVDLESRTGTRTDGEHQKTGWLDNGRPLCLGPFVIQRFVGDNQIGTNRPQRELPRAAPLVAVGCSHTLPEVSLEFLNGPSQAMVWPVRRVMSLIGSASGCKFRLTDASVSRFHASLLRTAAGLWIVDLLGQGGITVNDVPLRFSHLVDGDQLRIGRYLIRIRYQSGHQGGGNGLPARARSTPVTQPPRHDRASNGLMFPDWAAPEPVFAPGIEIASRPQLPMAIQAFSALTKVDVSGSEVAFPLKSGPGELPESALVPLVNQFGLMQQQMFDQFQQAMAMLVQMFGTMHRDQMAVIREELDRLRDLTEEFHALKRELANRTQEPNAPVSVSAGAVASGGSSGLKAAQGDGGKPSAMESPSVASSVPERRLSPTPRLSSVPPTSKSPEAHSRAEDLRESGLGSQAKTNGIGVPADSDRDSVVWLHQRIMILQRERETRWQKILKLLPGAT
jgi:pSer/pThr/pTyr-binding forkhead associated (FHA) protein